MGGRLAGDVSGVQFGQGCVEVVEVEHDTRHDPITGIDLDDVEGIILNRPGGSRPDTRTRMRARRSPRVARAPTTVIAKPTSTVACASLMLASRPWQDPGVDHSPAIVDGDVLGGYVEPRRASRRPQRTNKAARIHCVAVFSSRGAGRLSWSNFASAASRSASSNSSTRVIRSPSTIMMSTVRHSASKPSRGIPFPQWRLKTAPRSLSR